MRYTKYTVERGVRKFWSRLSKLSFTSVGLGLSALGFAVTIPVMALAANPQVQSPINSTVIVRPSSLTTTPDKSHWFFYNDETDTINNSLGSFVNGPGTPPLGSGSVQISVSGSQRRNLATYQFGGTKLADITQLKFSTYNPSAGNGGSANRSGYLNFNVDFDGSNTFQHRLAFVPSQNGTVVQNHWNSWDAINGGNALYDYSGTTWPGTSTPGSTARSLSDLIASYPGISILSSDPWVGIRVGEPYDDGYTENIDDFVFGVANKVTTFDFEATNQPSHNKDCTNNGWQAFSAPSFTSQKECEDWVHSRVVGHLKMSGPKQEIWINGHNVPDRETPENKDNKDIVRYINYDYPGGLDYTANVICTNANPTSKSAQVMWQIPDGHPGLSGLYVVAFVTHGNSKSPKPTYGHAATSDENTALQWCQSGVQSGFSPTMYTVTGGWAHVLQ